MAKAAATAAVAASAPVDPARASRTALAAHPVPDRRVTAER
jgi:hypothetical protein